MGDPSAANASEGYMIGGADSGKVPKRLAQLLPRRTVPTHNRQVHLSRAPGEKGGTLRVKR